MALINESIVDSIRKGLWGFGADISPFSRLVHQPPFSPVNIPSGDYRT